MSAIQGGNHVAANVADCALSLLDRADVAQSWPILTKTAARIVGKGLIKDGSENST